MTRQSPARQRRPTAAFRAFTLIELLVVIVVIVLLVALLVPAFRTARDRATTIRCQSNLQQIGHAIHLYASDWNDVLPSDFSNALTNFNNFTISWEARLIPYLGPMPSQQHPPNAWVMNPIMWCAAHRCSIPYFNGPLSQYSYNGALNWLTRATVNHQSTCLLVIDGQSGSPTECEAVRSIWPGEFDPGQAPAEAWHGGTPNSVHPNPTAGGTNTLYCTSLTLNAAYVDGHVEAIATNAVNDTAMKPYAW